MANFNFGMKNITSMINFNDMIPDISQAKQKLPEPIRKMIPDVDIKSKIDLNQKFNEFIDKSMGESDNMLADAQNEMDISSSMDQATQEMNLSEYGVDTSSVMQEMTNGLPKGISIG